MNGTSKFDRLVEIARSLAPNNRNDIRNHHVTFLLKKNKILSTGVNSIKTNTRNLRYDYINRHNKHIGSDVGTHSEHSGIIRLGREDCSDLNVVNIRIDRNGKLNCSFPCLGCRSLFKQVGFNKFWYSTAKGDFEQWIID